VASAAAHRRHLMHRHQGKDLACAKVRTDREIIELTWWVRACSEDALGTLAKGKVKC
jgi:hypothetical protein